MKRVLIAVVLGVALGCGGAQTTQTPVSPEPPVARVTTPPVHVLASSHPEYVPPKLVPGDWVTVGNMLDVQVDKVENSTIVCHDAEGTSYTFNLNEYFIQKLRTP